MKLFSFKFCEGGFFFYFWQDGIILGADTRATEVCVRFRLHTVYV